ncbi:MAG: cytochrome c3 family protein [Ignavibacteriae bacterium]|nr:cytochrome c3 family protein [Ignavibacteriota bacterium]
MKTRNTVLFIVFFIVCNLNYGQITGSVHDFSDEGWSNGQICLPCHAPHNNKAGMTPLWNHELSATPYTIYTNTNSMDATVGQPDGSSKLCLSCHDGTIAVDNYGGHTSTETPLGGSDNLGNNLSNDHPISFVYDANLATNDGDLFSPTSTSSGLGGTIHADMLENSKMQCSSCHDVHNGSGISKLLLKGNDGSALCLTCHDK